MNQYDDLLIRSEEKEEILIKDFKTISVFDEGDDRLRVFVANPCPFRFYTGLEMTIKEKNFHIYYPPQNSVKVGYSTTEQYALLYILGRVLANYEAAMPEAMAHSVKKALFDYRQRSLFE